MSPLYEYECKQCGHRDERSRPINGRHNYVGCEECDDYMRLVPSLFAHPVIGSIVDQSRIDMAPAISHSKAVKQSRFDAETAKRHRAADRINKQKDRDRSTSWKSKTFLPGSGVRTTYPKGLESDV